MASAFVPSPLPRSPRWPGLVASVGGENAIRRFVNEEAPSDGGVDRWIAGYEFQPYPCAGGGDDGGTVICAGSPAFAPSGGLPGVVQTDPVLMWESMSCSTLTNNAAELRERVANRLLASTSHRLEVEFWAGAVGAASGNQYLADVGSMVKPNGNTATPLVHALAALQASAGYIGQGSRLMIHASPYTASLWFAAGVVTVDASGVLLDAFGNVVVAGTGYDGTGTGVVFGSNAAHWAYATTVVNVRLSDVETVDATNTRIDRTNNVDISTASRVGAATWDDCVHVGVKIDHESICG